MFGDIEFCFYQRHCFFESVCRLILIAPQPNPAQLLKSSFLPIGDPRSDLLKITIMRYQNSFMIFSNECNQRVD
ncbi:hypothetical protein SAMN05443999_1043 [Roseovarius azorensis]|uniref:Uncharacterized protein n=1 Tax=Roseovarius azorensis TaxID=1287727 RepID=A0A1H7MZV2_9RHOB|nr:hypothetical protein SAMN05443999_1043 [Roseovarius azorensis]